MLIVHDSPADEPSAQDDWPGEVEFILSAFNAAGVPLVERRSGRRTPYRVSATLRLFSDAQGATPWPIYTRDVLPRGLGFITRHRLPLGYGGKLQLRDPRGKMLTVECTILRCREAINGWFEGAAYFNREQWQFADDVGSW